MGLPIQAGSQLSHDGRIAIVLEGVSEKWQRNVIQIRGNAMRVSVELDGHGTINAPAISLTPDQALHLARQISEILGSC